jgi:hypothetical protein
VRLDNADVRSAAPLSVSLEHNRAADIPAAHDHVLAGISPITHGRDPCIADFPPLQLQPLRLPSGPTWLKEKLEMIIGDTFRIAAGSFNP